MRGQLIIESETREKRSRFHDRDTVSFYPCDEHTSQYTSHKEYIREVDEDDRHSKSRIQRSRQYIWNYESYARALHELRRTIVFRPPKKVSPVDHKSSQFCLIFRRVMHHKHTPSNDILENKAHYTNKPCAAKSAVHFMKRSKQLTPMVRS